MIVGSEEKFWKSRSTSHTSLKRVTAQKPLASVSSCQWTGAFSRSQRYCANGWPLAKLEGERRSIFMRDIMTSPLRSIKGSVVLITGAASGMGRATAEVFAAEGAIVAATD